MTQGNVPLESQQEQQLPPAFTALLGDVTAARKMLLKDAAFKEPQQLRQFIAQFVLPMMENQVRILASGLVDTYSLATASHEKISRIEQEDSEGEGGNRIDLDDLNDLQKAFFAHGSLVTQQGNPELIASYEACATALAQLVSAVMDEAREDERDRQDEDDDEDDEDDDKVGT